MIATMVRTIAYKQPVLVMQESDSFDEIFEAIDEICSPYECEYKDVEIDAKIAIVWDVDDSCDISSLYKDVFIEEMRSSDGWLEFPQLSQAEIKDAEDVF